MFKVKSAEQCGERGKFDCLRWPELAKIFVRDFVKLPELYCCGEEGADIRGFLHTLSKRLIFLFFAGLLLAGCTATDSGPILGIGKTVDHAAPTLPLIDVAQRRAELATIPKAERHRWCQSSVERVYLARRAKIRGQIPNLRSNAQAAANALFANVEAYYAGESGAAREIRNALVKGSRIDAFTVLVPFKPRALTGYNVMNVPVFQVANFMVPLAHAYLILKKEYPGDRELFADVKRWGDELFELTRGATDDFIGQWRGIDRRARIAAGWAAWGNVANNHAALEHAYRYYLYALSGTGEGGTDLVWIDVPRTGGSRLSFVNATLQSALVAAHALHRSGVSDVYAAAPAGGTLVEGIAWFWDAYERARPSDLVHARHAGSRGVGWAELFLHEFPDHPLAAEIDAWLDDKRPLYVNMGGGPTTCLYRQVPQR